MNMNHLTPKSSNNEIHDLRYRISQLEHLIVQASLNTSSNLNQSSLPSNSSLLRTPHGLVERVNELEGLLAASELENETRKKNLEAIKAEKNRQEVILLEKLYKKDQEVIDLQHANNLLQVKLKKANSKIDNIQEYINGLPCQSEVDEAQSLIALLQEENQLLNGKITRMEEQIHKLQREVLDKEKVIQDAEVKIQELKPLEEAQLMFLKERDQQNLDLSNEKMISELLTVQKAQLIRSSKLISTLRDKLTHLDSAKADAVIKISNLESDIESLQEQFLSAQLKIDTMEQKIINVNQENSRLIGEGQDLRNEIQQRDNYLQMRNEQIKSLIKLVTEIDLCVNEVEKLVELGQSIAQGEEPPVSTLLGLSEDLELHLNSLAISESESPSTDFLSLSNSANFGDNNETVNFDPNDTEWALDRLSKVRTIRKNLSTLRDIANDLYTDMLGGKVEGCKVQ